MAAKRASKDKFRVGQRVILVLDAASGWKQANGEEGVVVGPKKHGMYWMRNLDDSGPRELDTGSERYAVRWKGGIANFLEYQLRGAYDGEEASTWDAFTKATGIRIDKELATMPIETKPRRTQRRASESEARRG
jgi:hypothetical protein